MSLLKGQILESSEKKVRFETISFAELLQQDSERRDDHFIRLRRNGLPPPRDLPKKEVEIPAEELHRRKLEQIEREAFQRAFAAGEEAGLAMGEQKKQEEIARLLPRFESILKHLHRMPARIFAASERMMVETCILLLQEMFKHELTVNKESLRVRVQKILDQLSRRSRMDLHLHPGDAEFLRELPEYSQLSLIADGTLEPGNIRLESEFGGVEDNLSLQMREAERSLREFLNGRLEEIGKGRLTIPPPEEDPWAQGGVGEEEPPKNAASPEIMSPGHAPDAHAVPPPEQLPDRGQPEPPQPERVDLDELDLSELNEERNGGGSPLPAGGSLDFLDASVASEDEGAIRPAPDDAEEAAWLAELLSGSDQKTPPAGSSKEKPASSGQGGGAPPSPPQKGVPPDMMAPMAEGGMVEQDLPLEGYDLSGLQEGMDLAELELAAAPPPPRGAPRPAPISDPLPDDEEAAAWVQGILDDASAKEVSPASGAGDLDEEASPLEGMDLSGLEEGVDLAELEFSAPPPGKGGGKTAPPPSTDPLPDDEEEADWVRGILDSATVKEVSPSTSSPTGEDDYAPGTVLDAASVGDVRALSGMGLSQAELDELLAEPDDVISDEDVAALLAQATRDPRKKR